MSGDRNPYTRESKSSGRRSSILKRQQSNLPTEILKRQESNLPSEGTNGNTESQRTPRRVSFARTAMVRYLHVSMGDESSASAGSSSSDNASTSSGSLQSMDNDSVFIPDPVPHSQAICEGVSVADACLTEEFLSASPEDQPRVLVKGISTFLQDVEDKPSLGIAASSAPEQNKTILYTSMNMSISDMTQLSNSVLWQNDSDEMESGCTSARQQEAHNHTILYTNMEEYDCCMDITSNISQLSESSVHQGDDKFPHDGFFKKDEIYNKPGLNRRPSFADEGTNETTDDQAFMMMDANAGQRNMAECTMFFNKGGDMEITQNLAQFKPGISYPGAGIGDSIVLKSKPKLLDDLFQLVKKQKPSHVTNSSTKENVAQDTTVLVKGEDEMDITQNLTISITNGTYLGGGVDKSIAAKSKPKMLDDLFQLVKVQKPIDVTDCSREENVSHGLEDMDITGDLSQVTTRTALSDITTYKTLTPIEEMSLISTNISLADQENRPPSKVSSVLQSDTHVSYMSSVCSKLEQTYGVQCSSNSLKPGMTFDKVFVSPGNKENYPVLNLGHKPIFERQRIITADQHDKSIQFGISSCSVVKENKSSGNLKLNECHARSIYDEQNGREDSEISIPSMVGNKNSAWHLSVTDSEGEKLRVWEQGSKTDTCFQNQETMTIQTEEKEESSTQREIDVPVLLKDSDDMEIAETDLKAVQQTCAQEFSEHMVFENQMSECPDSLQKLPSYACDDSEMEMTEGLSKTIYFESKFDEGSRKLKIFEDKSDADKCLVATESMTNRISDFQKEMARTKDNNTFTDNISDKSKIFDNSQMEFTEGLSKTIYFEIKANEELDEMKVVEADTFSGNKLFAGRNLAEVNSSSQVEMVKCPSDHAQTNSTQFGESHYEDNIFNSSQREMPDVSKIKKMPFNSMYREEANKLLLPEVRIDSKKSIPGMENMADQISRSDLELKEYPSAATFKGNKVFLSNSAEKNKIFTNSHTEMREGTAHTDNHRHPKQFSYDVPKIIACGMDRVTHCSDQITADCVMDISKSNSGTDLTANSKSSNFTDGCDRNHISVSQAKQSTQADLSATNYNSLINSNLIKINARIIPAALDISVSGIRTFQAENQGIIQSSAENMTCPNSMNSRELSISLEKNQLVNGDSERNTLPGAKIVRENAAVQDVDQKREALRQALSKEVGFPLSLSRSAPTFDLIQRRRTCNLLSGKGNNKQGKNDHFSFSPQVNINKTISMGDASSEMSDKKWLTTSDYADQKDDIFKVTEHSKSLSTFIYENTSSSSGSVNTDRTNSAETRLQTDNGLNIYREQPNINSPSGAAKFNYQLPPAYDDVFNEALESKEILNNQEMPELTDEIYDFKPAETSFEYKEDASFLSDLELISKMDVMPVSLQDLYQSLGISRLEQTSVQSVPMQVPTTTVKEKLITKVLHLSKLNCLKQHTNEIEATINRYKQECTEKLMQFSDKPPETLVLLFQKTDINLSASELKTKAKEMIHSCRMSAEAFWERHEADYLIKYSHAVEASREKLDCQVGNVISDTEKVLDLIANVDKCLHECAMLCKQTQDLAAQQKELEETERETQQLKVHCKEIDDRVMQLSEGNKEAVECLRSIEAGQEDIKERLSWMRNLIEWTIVKNTSSDIHFGFLFGTIILQVHLIESGSSHRKISKVTLRSKLGVKSKPWAQLAHSLAVSSIDCDKLKNSYQNYDEMHELLTDVSTIVNRYRHFSTELRLADLKHHLSIDDNRLMVTVLNRKTRQKIMLDTTITQDICLQLKFLWNVTTLIGSVQSQAVKSAIDRVEGGPNYITRVLSLTEQLLAQNNG